MNIYVEGVKYAILLAVRVCALIAGTSLLTYTTSPIVLTDAIESLLRPLAKLHFPVHELAMMMTIALRFIPTLIEETEKIMNAQKARGAMLDNGTFTQRIKALVPVLIPLFISAFRRADELAMAMECRCYHGGEGRTRLKQLKFTGEDFNRCAVIMHVALLVICLHTLLCAGAGIIILSRPVGTDMLGPRPFSVKRLLALHRAGMPAPTMCFDMNYLLLDTPTRAPAYGGFQVQPNAPTVCAAVQDAMQAVLRLPP